MRKHGIFQVGDVALGCGHATLPNRNGMTCEILGPLQLRTALEVGRDAYTTKLRYQVRWADGLESVAQPHNLKRPRRRQQARHLALQCIFRAKQSAFEVCGAASDLGARANTHSNQPISNKEWANHA